MMPKWMTPRMITVPLVVLFLLIQPMIMSDFFVDFILTKTMILGLAAASLVFLSAYGGMVSLAQWLIFGVAGFAIGNMVAESGHGLKLGWNPWVAVVVALLIATFISLVLGAVSARSTGIYFLMLTLVFGVIGFQFFLSVTTFSGFGGVTGIDPPSWFGDETSLYYVGVGLSLLAYLGFRAVVGTPFGMALQGVRDDPIRMSSLGFNIQVHRMLAFTLAGFVAGAAGVLNVWWQGAVNPASIGLGNTIDLLIIAVIGGMAYLEGAWLGAFVFVWFDAYLRDLPLVDRLPDFFDDYIFSEGRFNTALGLLLLVIMLLSPEGLAGISVRVWNWLRGLVGRSPAAGADDQQDPLLQATSS